MEQAGKKLPRIMTFTRKVIDHYDIYPTTQNVVAYSGGKAVACARLVEYAPGNNLLNLSFDFGESASKLKGSCAYLDMMAMLKEISGNDAVLFQLIRMALSHLAFKGIENALFVCPDRLMEVVRRIGFKPIADAFDCEVFDSRATPVTIEIREFYKSWLSNMKDQELIRFQQAFYYSIFDPGEVMAVEGERGSTAYLIEDGEVEVLIRFSGENLLPISTMHKGQMIGEVAMVTNEPRTASLITKSTTTCLSFDRADFMKLMYEEPHRSLDMFKIFSKRLNESNRKLAEMRK